MGRIYLQKDNPCDRDGHVMEIQNPERIPQGFIVRTAVQLHLLLLQVLGHERPSVVLTPLRWGTLLALGSTYLQLQLHRERVTAVYCTQRVRQWYSHGKLRIKGSFAGSCE